MNILNQPFVLLYLNLNIQALNIADEYLSVGEFKALDAISDKLIEMLPPGKVANMYKDKYHNKTKGPWSRHGILTDIFRHMDYEVKIAVEKFEDQLFGTLTLDNHAQKYIDVFTPIVDALYKNYKEKMEILNGVLNEQSNIAKLETK